RDDTAFMGRNAVGVPVERVLDASAAGDEAWLNPIKIDCVVKRGANDESIVEMARHFRGSGHILRFIEYMDVGNSNGWRMDDVVSGREIVETIGGQWPIEPMQPNYFGEVAERWRYRDGAGEVGVIMSVTQPF